MFWMACFKPIELVILAVVVAVAGTKKLQAVEINDLGNFTVALGSLLLVIASHQELLKVEALAKQPPPSSSELAKLERELQALKDCLAKNPDLA